VFIGNRNGSGRPRPIRQPRPAHAAVSSNSRSGHLREQDCRPAQPGGCVGECPGHSAGRARRGNLGSGTASSTESNTPRSSICFSARGWVRLMPRSPRTGSPAQKGQTVHERKRGKRELALARSVPRVLPIFSSRPRLAVVLDLRRCYVAAIPVWRLRHAQILRACQISGAEEKIGKTLGTDLASGKAHASLFALWTVCPL